MCTDEDGRDVRINEPLGFRIVEWTAQSTLTSPFDDIPEVVLERAVSEKVITAPRVSIAFSPDTAQLIGVPTWFWVDGLVDRVTDRAEVPGLVAQIEGVANPDIGLEIDPGNGTDPFTCRARSTAWDRTNTNLR